MLKEYKIGPLFTPPIVAGTDGLRGDAADSRGAGRGALAGRGVGSRNEHAVRAVGDQHDGVALQPGGDRSDMNYIGGGGGGGGRGAVPQAAAAAAPAGTDPEQAAAARGGGGGGGGRGGGRGGAAPAARSRRRPWSVGHGTAGTAARQAAVRTHHGLQHEHRRHRVAGRQRRHLRVDQDAPGAERRERFRKPAAPTKAASSSRRRWHLPDRAADCSEAAAAADRCSTPTTR